MEKNKHKSDQVNAKMQTPGFYFFYYTHDTNYSKKIGFKKPLSISANLKICFIKNIRKSSPPNQFEHFLCEGVFCVV